jgi:hypothetical protein
VLLEEMPHPVFERDGTDLHVEVPAPFPLLALGGKIEMPTLEGTPTTADVPAGTPSGKVIRIKGRGLPGLRGGKGDLPARLMVFVPTKLGPREQALGLGASEAFKPPRQTRASGPGQGCPRRLMPPRSRADRGHSRRWIDAGAQCRGVCVIRPRSTCAGGVGDGGRGACPGGATETGEAVRAEITGLEQAELERSATDGAPGGPRGLDGGAGDSGEREFQPVDTSVPVALRQVRA